MKLHRLRLNSKAVILTAVLALACTSVVTAAEWDGPIGVSNVAQTAREPHLSVGPAGKRIGATWAQAESDRYSLAFTSSDDGGESWREPTVFRAISSQARSPKVVSLLQGNAFLLIWIEDAFADAHLWVAKVDSFGNLQAPPIALTQLETDFIALESLSIASSADGRVVEAALVLRSFASDRLLVYRTEDQALTWSSALAQPPSPLQIKELSLSMSSSGDSSLLTWVVENGSLQELRYASALPPIREWSHPQALATSSEINSPSAVLRSSPPTADLAWLQRTDETGDVLARAASLGGVSLSQQQLRDLGPASPVMSSPFFLASSQAGSMATAIWTGPDRHSIVSRTKVEGNAEWDPASLLINGTDVITELRATRNSSSSSVVLVWSTETSIDRRWWSSSKIGQVSAWSNPAALTVEPNVTGLLSDPGPVLIAAVSGEGVYLAISATKPNGNVIEFSRSVSLDAWTDMVQLSPSGEGASPPILAVADDGRTQVLAWDESSNEGRRVVAANSSTSGSSWNRPVQLSTDDSNPTLYSLRVSRSGNSIAAFMTEFDAASNRVAMVRSEDGGISWGAVRKIHEFSESNYAADVVGASSAGLETKAVAWLARSDVLESIEVSQSVNNGESWSLPASVTSGFAFNIEHLDFSLSSNAAVQTISWSDTSSGPRATKVLLSRDGGTSWGEINTLSQPSVSVRHQKVLVSESGETLLVIWAGWDGSANRVFTAHSMDAGQNWSSPALRWTATGGINSLQASGSDSLSVVAIAVGTFPDDLVTLLVGSAGAATWSAAITASDEDEYASIPLVSVSSDGARILSGWYQPSEQENDQGAFIESTDAGTSWTPVFIATGYNPVTSVFPARSPQLALSDAGATLAWAYRGPLNMVVRASRTVDQIGVFSSGFEAKNLLSSGAE